MILKSFIEKQKQKLKKQKQVLEEQLQGFAKKDPKVKGNWQASFPEYDGSETGGSRLEVAQDEVEEYLRRLPLEQAMELKLQNIELALEKIKKGNYGKCKKCKKNIALNRLEACPEAQYCLQCQPKT